MEAGLVETYSATAHINNAEIVLTCRTNEQQAWPISSHPANEISITMGCFARVKK